MFIRLPFYNSNAQTGIVKTSIISKKPYITRGSTVTVMSRGRNLRLERKQQENQALKPIRLNN